MLTHIDAHKNCEDIAMAYVVARKSQAAPVWVKATVFETNFKGGGISDEKGHFVSRSSCLDTLRNLTSSSTSNTQNANSNKNAGDAWPWVTGYQKVVKLGVSDWGRAWRDTK
eukprot:gene26605-33209_t